MGINISEKINLKIKLYSEMFFFSFQCTTVFFLVFALVVWGIRIQPTFALVRVVKGD